MTEPAPRYRSASTFRSIWQEYRIYDDRLELETHFGTLTIPFDVIETLEIRPSDLKELALHGDLQLKGFRPALKLDWANFVEHIVLDKSEGWVRRILFTPDDPDAFRAAFTAALEAFRAEH